MADQVNTPVEKEIFVLRAVWELIHDMVNYEMFLKNHATVDAHLRFSSMTHQRLFNILLADFLSSPSVDAFDLPRPASVTATAKTHLGYVLEITRRPQLNPHVGALEPPARELRAWLEDTTRVEKIWLPSIGVERELRVSRIDYIKICGNIAKHVFTRLDHNVRTIQRVLLANDIPTDAGQAYRTLPEFYQWFHDHVFSYHATVVAALLNNLRWGIYEYLQPEFRRSFERLGTQPSSIMYRFNPPEGCRNELAVSIYWDLMNAVRSPPWFPRFTVSPYLQTQF